MRCDGSIHESNYGDGTNARRKIQDMLIVVSPLLAHICCYGKHMLRHGRSTGSIHTGPAWGFLPRLGEPSQSTTRNRQPFPVTIVRRRVHRQHSDDVQMWKLHLSGEQLGEVGLDQKTKPLCPTNNQATRESCMIWCEQAKVALLICISSFPLHSILEGTGFSVI